MKVYVGSDHAGFGLKEKLVPYLMELGYEVDDKGAREYNEGDDYPDYIIPVAREVSQHPKDAKGIILGASGQGEAMTANKFSDVRAAVYYGEGCSVVEDKEASIINLARSHNDSNILSIGAHFVTEEDMKKAVRRWLETPFSADERHERRLAKMDRIHE